MDREVKDIYWLAGFLDGEGSFGVTTRISNGKTLLQFVLQASSTDKDIIQKASSFMVTAREKFNGYPRDGNRKKIYSFCVNGTLAIGWMMTLYPLMSLRRKARIREVIYAWKGYTGRRSSIPLHQT